MAKIFEGSFGMKAVAVGLVVGVLLVAVGMSGVLESGDRASDATYVGSLESRLYALIGDISGISDVRVMVHSDDIDGERPEIIGVAVVCKGISDVKQNELVMLITSLFGIPSTRVYVAVW